MTLASERLILRQWRDGDREAFAALNADPVVMEFFPATRTRPEADKVLDILIDHIDRHGFGFWALELRETGETVGFTGLQNVDFEAPFAPAVEIGWRLARPHWGKGYATEAARAALDYAFGALKLDEVVSFAVEDNMRSRRVMERIGMVHEPALDFVHPSVDPRSRIARHAFYRITRRQWQSAPPP
jgi:RimJ/RimL family protein N-acetyltransferase